MDIDVVAFIPSASVWNIQWHEFYLYIMGNAAVLWFGPIPPIGRQGTQKKQTKWCGWWLRGRYSTDGCHDRCRQQRCNCLRRGRWRESSVVIGVTSVNITISLLITTTLRQQRQRQRWRRFDDNNDGIMMGDRKIARAAPPIWGNNQLRLIVGGGRRQERGWLWGIGWLKRVEVEAIWWWDLSSTKSFPYHFPRTPEHWKDRDLFPMRSGCTAALSAPWSARVPGPIGGLIDRGGVSSIFSYFGQKLKHHL